MTTYLTLDSADHREALDDDLTGRWENARDDSTDADPTPVMEDIDAVLGWLAANDDGAAYPKRLAVTGLLGSEQEAQLRVSLENLADYTPFITQLQEEGALIMGATDFFHPASGKTAQEAFRTAAAAARHEYGHGGYTGSIAEKDAFVLISVPAAFVHDPAIKEWGGEVSREAQYAAKLIRDADPRIDDKWGPAGCIALPDGGFLFFGWAST